MRLQTNERRPIDVTSRPVDRRALRLQDDFRVPSRSPMSDHPARTERALHRRDLHPDPMAQFTSWLGDAEAAGVPLPNAMGLATADAEGARRSATCSCEGSTTGSCSSPTTRAARAVSSPENPHAALVFLWKALERQVERDGDGREGRPRSRRPTSERAHVRLASERGHRRRAGCSPRGMSSTHASARSRIAIPTRSRCRRSGAATA